LRIFPLELEERGVSEALGAALVLSIFLAAFSAWYPTYVRTSVYDSEAKHMDEVRSAFLRLQSGISLLQEGESLTLNLPMESERPRFVPTSGRVGRVVVRASPQAGVGSLLGEGLGLQGVPESLRGEGGGWYELSPLVFLEKFWSLENWTMNPGIDDTDTPSPEWSPYKSAVADGSGSIHVATSTDLPEWEKENCSWVRTLSRPLSRAENVEQITITGRMMFSLDVGWWGSGNGRVRVEVRDNQRWKTVYSGYRSSSTSGWVSFENSYRLENSVSEIRLYLEVNAYSARADLWVDEVSLVIGPPYRVGVEYSSGQAGSPEGVSSLTVTTKLRSEEAPALCTLRIYRPSTGEWENLRRGVVREEVVWENTITHPQPYFDNQGKIRLRLEAENSTSFFRLCQDYLRFSLEYGLPRGGGSLEFEMRNSQYPSQTYVYEDGAVILLQGDSGVMLSEPNLLTVRERTENEVEIWVNRYFVVGRESSLSQGGWTSLRITSLGSYFAVKPENQPNRENVTLEITSPRREVWRRYLQKLEGELNSLGLHASLHPENNLLTILGRVTENGKKDLYYYERVYELYVEAS
jgi:hypothetical protein